MSAAEPLRVIGSPRATVILRGMPPPPEAVLRRMPAETGVHTVVVAASPAPGVRVLADLLAERLPVGCRAIRLVLSGGGRNDLAGELADRLRLTVFAPDGPVLLLESGMLFVAGGAWLEFRPERRPTRGGARHPAPPWQQGLEPLPRAGDGLSFTEVPAGLWLHPRALAGRPLPLPLLTVPVDGDRTTVLVGHPEAPPAGFDTMESLLGLPRAIRRRLTLIPYGPDSMRVHEMAERIAVGGGDVEVVNGVPDTAASGALVHTTLDDQGRRGWRPAGERFAYRGAAPPVLRAPATARFWSLGEGWGVEVVRSGWLVREARADADTDMARRIVPVSAHPLLVLAPAVTADAELARRLVGRVAGGLPDDLRPLLRLAVTRPPAPVPAWRQLVGEFGDLLGVTGDGTLVTLPNEPAVGGAPKRSAAQPVPAAPASASPDEPTADHRRRAVGPPVIGMPAPSEPPTSTVDPALLTTPAPRSAAPGASQSVVAPTSARPFVAGVSPPVASAPRRGPEPVPAVAPDRRPPGEHHREIADGADVFRPAAVDHPSSAWAPVVTGVAAEPGGTPASVVSGAAAEPGGPPASVATGAADKPASEMPGHPSLTGAVPAAWPPPVGPGWLHGVAYPAPGPIGAGGTAPDGTIVVVWSDSARPVPSAPGGPAVAAMFPPGARFAVAELTGSAVLLHEIGDGDPAVPPPPEVLRSLRRTAAALGRAATTASGAAVSPGR